MLVRASLQSKQGPVYHASTMTAPCLRPLSQINAVTRDAMAGHRKSKMLFGHTAFITGMTERNSVTAGSCGRGARRVLFGTQAGQNSLRIIGSDLHDGAIAHFECDQAFPELLDACHE